MCKPASEGGQRCAAHTRKAVDKAMGAVHRAKIVAEAAAGGNDRAFEAAQGNLDRAMEDLRNAQIEHATTPTGRREFEALENDPAQGRYARIVLAKAAELRQKNQAVADAVAAVTAKKPTPTAPAAVSLDQIEPGDTFYWDGDNHVLEDFRTDPDDPDMWEVETATMNLSIPKSNTVEPVEEEPFIGESDEERFAAVRDEEAQVTGSTVKPDAAAQGAPKAVKLTEEQFEDQYKPILQSDVDEDTNAYWDEPPTGYPANRIWTVVEGDDNENHYLLPGTHYVNRIGYIASEKPWTDPNIEVLYFDHVNLMDKD